MPWDPKKASFEKGIMVFPVEYTKGLEFDAVLMLDPDRESYPTDDGHAKLLYVAATRALHRLEVLHTGNLTGLIADPIPKKNKKRVSGAKKRSSSCRIRPADRKHRCHMEPTRCRKVRTHAAQAEKHRAVPVRRQLHPGRHLLVPAGRRARSRLFPVSRRKPSIRWRRCTGATARLRRDLAEL